MKKRSVLLGPLVVLSLTLTASAWAQPQAQTNQGTAVAQSPLSQPSTPGNQPDLLSTMPGVLVSTESLLGIDVKNAQGQDVGALKHLMIDSRTGRVMYAVVPWEVFWAWAGKPWWCLGVP